MRQISENRRTLDLVGFKELELTSSRNIQLVTTLSSVIPILLVTFALVFIGVIIVLTLIKKLSLRSILKLLAVVIIIITLTQPWWGLSGSSNNPKAERETKLFISPQVMIESTDYEGKTVLDIAEMPELYVDALEKIVLVLYATCIILGLSFISSKFRKKHYSLLLCLLGVILLIVIISMFYVGTSKLSETSIGDVQGEGSLNITIGEETVVMSSTWGFNIGFYLIIVSLLFALNSILLEIREIFLKSKQKR